MLSIIAVLVVGAVAVAVLAGSSVARTRAQAAADLAALSAATAAMYGSDAPCETAWETARRNGAEQTSCDAEAGVFTVSVQVPAPAGGTARATARAGPASTPR